MGTSAISTRRGRSNRPSSLTTADVSSRIIWISSAAFALFLAVALLSFNAADPPSHIVAVHNSPVSNLCGIVGAWIAFWTYHVLGFGVWVMLFSIGTWVTLVFRGREVEHPAVRALGVLIMALAVACFHQLLFPAVGSLAGAKAGLIAKTLVGQLTLHFSSFGAFIIIFAAFSIGLVVAAERIAFAIPHLIVSLFKGSLSLRPGNIRALSLATLKPKRSTETEYEEKFCSVFQKNNIFGVQFHPEKSQKTGQILLRNFLSF